jgi:hydrogenase nickel incorporation protein HypB
MDPIRIIEVKENVLAKNDRDADKLRAKMKENKTLLINIMSSPGSGKTTLLKRTIKELKDEMKIGVLEADIDSDVDAAAILGAGADSVQLHTGGACHLTADMTEQGLAGFGDKHYDLVFIENVGNLVCPAEFDTGATMNVCLLSVPEGDDKPLKYPLMFQVSHALVVTKIDVRSVFDFDLAKLEKNARMRHPGMKIMPLSAKTGDGFEEWINFLREKVAEQKK